LHFVNKFSEVKYDVKKTWGLIKTVLNHDVPKSDAVSQLMINGKLTTDLYTIVNQFNKYFSTIGQNLASQIPPCAGNFSDIINHNYSINESLFILPTNKCEIFDAVCNLKATKSPGYDCISPKIVKAAIDDIAEPLTVMFNYSFVTGTFPDMLKIAKVCPVYKCDDKLLVSNYRPISVLPVFSKILERIMYNRVVTFINQQNVLSDSQYGFRDHHSTYMALLNLVDRISNSIESKHFSVGVFMDLSKAFDTVDHSILLEKLKLYGIRGVANNWIRSYLCNRVQFVQIQHVKSSRLPVTCGVPQGSILGPLLFLIYINDITHVSKIANTILFADDTNLFFGGPNIDLLCLTINDELDKIATWFNLNKLSLNIKKTNFIMFKSRNCKNHNNINIKIRGINIERVVCTKFLGVIINERLTWNDHIMLVKQKVSKNIGVIARIRYCVPFSVLIMLYHTLIEPYLQYCNIVWATHQTVVLQALHRSQKKVVRLITHSHWQSHTKPLFGKCGLLSVFDINKLQIGCFMYCAIHNMLPNYFCVMFVRNLDIHSYSTRQKDDLHLSGFRTNIGKFTIRALGPRVWNSLDPGLKALPSLHSFKAAYKFLLLSYY